MSIMISDLTYHYPNQSPLFQSLNFSVKPGEHVSLVGSNGTGKSTLLRLIAGLLPPDEGRIITPSQPCYIPQHTGQIGQNVAEALHIHRKLTALDAILKGSVAQEEYDTLADDWDIEARSITALTRWGLNHLALNTPMDSLSGGEKSKVYLAGLDIHSPEIILMDEPTNHLDQSSREQLYHYISQSHATIIVVSHDLTLLNQIQTTYELSGHGIRLYGGNYSFYKSQKETETQALDCSIHEQEKALRLARKQAQEVKQRQERRASQADKAGGNIPRITLNALHNSAEQTASRLQDTHAGIILSGQSKLSELRQQREALKELKIDFDNTSLHPGKLLVKAEHLNFGYPGQAMLWSNPLELTLYSHDRIHLKGDNGSGKSTLIQLLTGSLEPSEGSLTRNNFRWIYLDQEYSQVDADCTIAELAEQYNLFHLKEHEVKLRLNRFLFPSETWDKSCRILSGGEKMRLYLCCLMISNQTPDLIILDEPTNNLDIPSVEILSRTIRDYKGAVWVISHDAQFTKELGITGTITLNKKI